MLRTFSDADLPHLSFHDVTVYGYAAVPERYELRFDLDFIAEWLCPPQGPGPMSFRVSPATLVFENAGSLEARIRAGQGVVRLEALERSDFQRIPGASLGTWLYELRTQEDASVRLRASGFRLHLRSEPVLTRGQSLGFAERGGISFAVPGE